MARTSGAAVVAALILQLAPAAAGADATPFGDRPDAHAPIGVMGEHLHAKGEWMLSYRFAHMRMDGNRTRTNHLGVSRVLRDFAASPTDMDVDVHIWGLMFAPSDSVTLTAMIPFLEKSMDHRRDGQEFETNSSNLGDIRMAALIRLWRNERQRVHFNAGFSLPTGSTGQRGQLPAPPPRTGQSRLPYPMQIGSGSFDLMPGLTYVGHSDAWSWGGQALGTIRTSDNTKGYRLGNAVDLTGWIAKPLLPWLSASLRGQWAWWDDYSGKDDELNPATIPTADPNRRGGHRLDLLAGLNFLIPLGGELNRYSHRLAIEAGFPAYQWRRGPQLETDWRIVVGWQKAFRPFSFSPVW
jgi:hypothetical protein